MIEGKEQEPAEPGDTTGSGVSDKLLPDPAGNHPVPRQVTAESWDAVLSRAGEQGPPVATLPPPAQGRAGLQAWARVMVPVAILVVYLIYKFGGGSGDDSRRPPDFADQGNLSGVKPRVEEVKLDAATKKLAADLELLWQQQKWKAIRDRISNEPPERRDNDIIAAFDTLARVESGDTNGVLMTRLRELETRLAQDEDRSALVDYLRLMQAELYLRVTNSPDALQGNTDRLRSLLAPLPITPRVATLRTRLSLRCEEIGKNEEEAAARGRIQADPIKLLNARAFYQQGLRWVTTREGWMSAQPITSGEAGLISERLLTHLRQINSRIHGPVMPWSDKDNKTWTGAKGDPVHDYPGGSW